jgi:peptide/nickel transport system permease protein
MKRWMAFAAKRLTSTSLAMALASALLFAIASQAPGDFLSDLRGDPRSPDAVIEAEARRLGLKDTWLARYATWINEVRRGNWGASYASGIPVSELLWPRLAKTL